MATLVFDAAVLSRKDDIPPQFVWPADEAPSVHGLEEIVVPVVDIAGFLAGDGSAGAGTGGLRDLAAACEKHGFFQVVNHGVDPALLAKAYQCCDAFYTLPLAEKQRAQRRLGENHGYAGSFVGRFGSKLPWKETMSFNCSAAPESARKVVDYFVGVLGEEYRDMGYVPTYVTLFLNPFVY